MKSVIDLGSEVLIDQSKVRIPHLRLLLAAIGVRLAKGSPWMAVNKQVAEVFSLTSPQRKAA